METRDLIRLAVSNITSEIGYCGSCMGGCDPMTKFLCLGISHEILNREIEKIVNKNNAEYDH